MTLSILENNIAYLPEYLQHVLPMPIPRHANPASIQVVQGSGDWPVAAIINKNSFIHTNSMTDPWLEAERWAQALDYEDNLISLIYGCGFGYPLLEYAKRKKTYTDIYIVEQNIDLFVTLLQSIDIRPLLQDPTFHFIIGSVEQIQLQLQSCMTGDFLLRSTKLTSCFTWLAHRNEKQSYLELHEWILNTLSLMAGSIGNSIHDTLIGLYNTLDNVDAITHSTPLSEMRDAFAGKPAFIVSNGPSLDTNIEHLAKAVGRSLILTAESALRPCLSRNITPDAICVTERSPDVYHYHFANQKLPEKLVIVGLTLIDPRITKLMKGSWIPVFRSLEHSSRWIRESITEEVAVLKGGSSSAHLAFEFALWTGASPIIFVGQDLAFGDNKQTHSMQSVYAEDRLAAQVQSLRQQPEYVVPGVDGNPVLTTKLWHEFKSWFEQQIRLHPQTRFIDATEGGAYIQGTELMTLQMAVAAFCAEPLVTTLYPFVQNRIPSGQQIKLKETYARLIERTQQIRDTLRQLIPVANNDLRSCRIINNALLLHDKYPNTDIPSYIEALVNANGKLYEHYMIEPVITFIQHIIFAFNKQMNDIGEIHSKDRLKQLTDLQKQMIDYLRQTFERLTAHFGQVEETLQQRLERCLTSQ
ncbi:Uncharacterized conserved protein [Paenibacillus sp. 1_12]|uniref:motility associated factor glycosyltransferase family protein n=1 Tax=Paenibacillus sp. 1_12 TaxID=1566278 RepID=UPI0008F2D13F|nr:6-hydroxymethylpterin diphosphokinase MptE-like protein [Paenibacillus sp. 1_12]SFK81307.1 Uncharacterized conserved protein [Paenibacillus sp. 1_12]